MNECARVEAETRGVECIGVVSGWSTVQAHLRSVRRRGACGGHKPAITNAWLSKADPVCVCSADVRLWTVFMLPNQSQYNDTL